MEQITISKEYNVQYTGYLMIERIKQLNNELH